MFYDYDSQNTIVSKELKLTIIQRAVEKKRYGGLTRLPQCRTNMFSRRSDVKDVIDEAHDSKKKNRWAGYIIRARNNGWFACMYHCHLWNIKRT